MSQVLINPANFAHDLNTNLGRANGNVYQRIPGIDGVHDGQIMIRLKSKRFIVLDYSIQPNALDYEVAATTLHVKIPKGAGRQICRTDGCSKIGVPVALYDSDPTEPDSLYIRSGLCFHCQRELNEKRRTDRKKRTTTTTTSSTGSDHYRLGDNNNTRALDNATFIYAIGPATKRFKYKQGGFVEVNANAVILNGGTSTEGLKQYYNNNNSHDGSSSVTTAQEMMLHATEFARHSAVDMERLWQAVSNGTSAAVSVLDTAATTTTTIPHSTTSAEAAASAVVVDAVGHDPSNLHLLHPTGATESHVHSHTQPHTAAHAQPPHSAEEINALYLKAFHNTTKALFALTQWKTAWDSSNQLLLSSTTTPLTSSSHDHPSHHHDPVDASLAEAVASAAALAASDGHNNANTDNMVSLLLAADRRKEFDDDVDVDAPSYVDVV